MNFDYISVREKKYVLTLDQITHADIEGKYKRDSNSNLILVIKRSGEIVVNQTTAIEGLTITNLSKNSTVLIYEGDGGFDRCSLVLRGSNHLVRIKASRYKLKKLSMELKGTSLRLFIDEDFSCSGANINVREANGIFIGRDCMFSNGINILNSDMHAIFDESGKCINHGKDVVIGDHVWIGQNAQILKGVFLADGTVVGAQAVVTKSNMISKSIMAGNPAKVIKSDIEWSRLAPFNFD